MRNNNQSNAIIKWAVVAADFVLLNVVVLLFLWLYPDTGSWGRARMQVFWLMCNIGMVLSQYKFSTIIHERIVTASDMMRRVTLLVISQAAIAYILLKIVYLHRQVGWPLVGISATLFVLILLSRFVERLLVKRFRRLGRNTRYVTFVGSDIELLNLYKRKVTDPAAGYKVLGYYADEPMADDENGKPLVERLGTLEGLLKEMASGQEPNLGDEVYVCLSRREREAVKTLSAYCDRHVIRFYFVPVSVESLGISLKREMIDDIEVYTTYENPLQTPANKALKRAFDVVMSSLFLLFTLPLFPIIALVIKLQSPGPIFFRQLRTGIDGKNFYCYKFRSMHVNADADRVQATKDDPRKYAFGNFMRKANIDELPQFWNVLKGEMSVVGPRPHMLAHTEMYSQLIGKYMVRHFVKPGVTGWAQVTGFRGETKELWQMEERVKRDIWYMEHWSFWLDLRIIWMTVKTIFVHDEKAY